MTPLPEKWRTCFDATAHRAGAVPEITCASFGQFKRELVEPSLSRNNGRLIKTTDDGA